MKYIISIFLNLLLLSKVCCQEPYYRTISTEDGLPSNTVHTVFTDSKGYIWFGTPNGAVRWDSKNFKTYTIEDGLPNNEVLGFFEDSLGRLWISTFSNELCYLKDKVIYTKSSDKRLARFNIILSSNVFQFKNHLIIQSSINNLIIDINSLDSVSQLNNLNYYYSFLEIDNKLLGYNWNGKTPNYTLFKVYKNTYSGSRIMVNDINKIDNLILKNQFKTKILFSNPPFNYENIRTFFIDSVLGPEYNLAAKLKARTSLHLFEINKLLFSIEDNIKYYFKGNKSINLNSNNVLKLFEMNDEIHFLSDNRIYNLRNKVYLNFNAKNLYNIEKLDGNFNIASSNSGINIISKSSIKNLILESDLYGNFKYTSYNKKTKSYFIGSSHNLLMLRNQKLTIIKPFKTYFGFLDSEGRLWHSDLNKLYYCDNFIDTIYDTNEFSLNNKKTCFIREIQEDKYSNIFFTTNDGIYIYDRKTNIKYSISKSNFLSSNECSKLILDNRDKSFWVATPMGINHIEYRYHHNKLQFKLINRFLKDDGLPSNEINDILIKGDSVYVATPQGLSLITNKDYRPDTTLIPIHINEFKVNDSLLDYDTNIRLSSNQTNLEIDFSAIYYLRRDRIAIKYLLIRNGDTSQYMLSETKLRLNALKSGDYELIISAYDIDYPYNNGRSKSFKFTIDPPFYQTWWFYSLILLGLAGLAYIVYKRKLDRLREFSQYEKKISLLKLEALKAEMNPHFIFNCLSAIKDYVMQADVEKSQYYLGKLAKLIRLALYNSKDEFISLGEEIQFIDTYIELERMRFDDKFDFIKEFDLEQYSHIQIPTMILQPFIENAIRHGKIGQLDKQGKLYLSIYDQDDYLVFDIRDNGMGYKESQKLKATGADSHRSMAMDIIQERIAIYNRSYQLKIRHEIRSLENNNYKTQILVFIHLKNL